MVTKQIPNPRKMFNLVEDRHKKRGFLIRSMHGSIQNQKEAKLPNSHKVTFLSKFSIFTYHFRALFIGAYYMMILTLKLLENERKCSD